MTRSAMKASVVLASVLAATAFAFEAAAHEGHDHKVMGTVSAVDQNHLEVKTRDGKTTTFVLDANTRVLRDKTPIKTADIEVGERVVVTAAQAKEGMVAKEIRVAASSRGSTKKP
jgi:hypothetical protein